jgi:predicted porin
MKKSLVALAALAAFAGAASAQSSVTLYGTLDLSVRRTDNTLQSQKAVSPSGLSASRWGMRGTETISSDLSAGFTLEAGISPDTGNGSTPFFNRRATASLISKSMGEVRFGRDKTPVYVLQEAFDPFGAGGSAIGSFQSLAPNVGGQTTFQRFDNSIQYFLPSSLGSVYGSVALTAAEGVNGNKFTGGQVGYKSGPLNVGFAVGKTKVAPVSGRDSVQDLVLGASYNFGGVVLSGLFQDRKLPVAGRQEDQKVTMLGLTSPAGKDGSVRLSYTQVANDSPARADNARQLAVGYTYNLSKRTAVYSNFSNITNDASARYKTNGEGIAAVSGKAYRGIDLGVRHNF